MSETVGFIGIGIMGLGMCHNLIKTGHHLVVWNRDKSKAEALAKEEASAGKVTVVDSAREVVEKCTLTYSMLSTIEASEAVWPTVLEGLGAGKMLVDCATFTPERMKMMSDQAVAKGAQFLEAPVSGSKGPAEQGQLIFLTSGSEAVKDAAAKGLEAMGKSTQYYGAVVGKGTEMKIVVNMIMGIQLNAVTEGVALAEACDLPVGSLVDVLNMGAMASPMIKLKGPQIEKKEYAPAFPLKHAQKDMRFAIQLGDQKEVALPVAAVSNEQYKKARCMGYGEKDFAAVAEASRSGK
eukprot:TRINITY_DN5050_c0_g1_i1.p1 TRINITY_DN5050_c0_g1~~TRINITY_DN5050_c0_g1_i1.p1  ORF type:complete len:294 (-),score=109.71 TRINITY_DN5050_c0_g1_i1:186-1067(-)